MVMKISVISKALQKPEREFFFEKQIISIG